MTTNNHPAHGPVSLDRLHQISEILSKAAAQSDGGNLGCAMADAVKVIDGAIASRNVETIYQVMYGECWRDITEEQYHDHAIHESPIRIVYTAPPAQLVNTIDETLIEALRLVQCMLDDYRERNYGRAQEWIRHISAKMDDYSEQHGDDAYSVISAAMLQAGNSPVIPDGWAMVPIKPTEDMIIDGFESEPDEDFSDPDVWEKYQAMSGCQQAAHRARLCWAAMIAAAPKLEDGIV
ncbi:hypothetical protein ACWOOC_15295 [Citrobacter sp. ESY80]